MDELPQQQSEMELSPPNVSDGEPPNSPYIPECPAESPDRPILSTTCRNLNPAETSAKSDLLFETETPPNPNSSTSLAVSINSRDGKPPSLPECSAKPPDHPFLSTNCPDLKLTETSLVVENESPPNTSIPSAAETNLKSFIDDATFHSLRRHFLMKGKGRRPDVPCFDAVTNKLLMQLYYLKEESGATYQVMSSWLRKLSPSLTAPDVDIYKRTQEILRKFPSLACQEDVTALLASNFDISFEPLPECLTALGIKYENLFEPDSYSSSPQLDVSNEVVMSLSKLIAKKNYPPITVRKMLLKLSLASQNLTEMKLRTKINNVVSKAKKMSKNKKDKDKLQSFLKLKFIDDFQTDTPAALATTTPTANKHEILTPIVNGNESDIIKLRKNLEHLKGLNESLKCEKEISTQIILELQQEKVALRSQVDELRKSKSELSALRSKIKMLEKELISLKSTTVYKRNHQLKQTNDVLQRKVDDQEGEMLKMEGKLLHLKKKIKSEQDSKSKYKIKSETLTLQNDAVVSVLKDESSLEAVPLKQKENNSTMYSDTIRQVYMTIIGELGVSCKFASKVVALIANKLCLKEISLSELPCARTCSNFMYEANHIAKQQIVARIKDNDHFTYATDGTGREKRHYLEHHIVLSDKSVLSIGYSEVPDDKAQTLLDKSLDLFDELTDVYCDAEGGDRMAVYKEILSKLKALMSDRAANMKLFNKKMLAYKKEMVGEDAAIHFLYCNAHFLIGLAEETEKAVKIFEAEEEESGQKMGRGKDPAFKNWNSTESSASRLLRTASDVFGPRGDEKNGCREEWLAHCNFIDVTSLFTSYRSNRFNCLFENAVALLHHHKDAVTFLRHYASNNNLKLQSICGDIEDERVMSVIAAIALASTFITTPYWSMMNSKMPYGQFPEKVRALDTAIEKWTRDDFSLAELKNERPLFGEDFCNDSNVALHYYDSSECDRSLTTSMFKSILNKFKEVIRRQLFDFLPGGIFGDSLPDDLQNFLSTCPLTNLTGERMFGDLDYNMTRRRTASTFLQSSLNMWKHNTPSKFLDNKSPVQRKKIMTSARKNGKRLKEKHNQNEKAVKEKIKSKIIENNRQKKEKEISDKEKQAALLGDILSQGGLCSTKEDFDRLFRSPNVLQNLKCQIRFRKYYMGAKELRLTGNMASLLSSLCNHLGLVYEPPHQNTKKRLLSSSSSSSNSSEGSDLED